MEGGIGFGLGAALYGAITVKDGRVEQSNFNSYRVLRMNEMPKVEVHIVPSTEAPTGVGEPGVAPLGPAVANALFAATRETPLRLPHDQGKRVDVTPAYCRWRTFSVYRPGLHCMMPPSAKTVVAVM